MNEKEFMKKVTDMNMPDIDKINKRIINGNVKKQSSVTARRLVPIFACAFVLVCTAVILPSISGFGSKSAADMSQQNTACNKDQMMFPSGSPEAAPEAGEDNADTGSGSVNALYFNDMAEISTSAKLFLDPEKTYEKTMTIAEVIDFLGRDVRPTYVPEGLVEYSTINPDSLYTVVYNNDGTPAYEQFTFSYEADFNNTDFKPLEKTLNLTVSKTKVMRCGIFICDENMRESVINGQNVMLGYSRVSYGPYEVAENGENIPTGYYDLYVAQFAFKGIEYEVIANNLTQEEFVSTIESIIY